MNKKAEISPDILHYKELLKEQGIKNINEVITLRQLRTEYKTYETKRQLVAAYDVFLCEQKIAQCLPRLLGNPFFRKRKLPIQINMKTSNLKKQVEKALTETQFHLTCRGDTCTIEVAALCMKDSEIQENITTAVKALAEKIPGQSNNILGIYVKTAKSKAIPIYVSFDNPSEVKIEEKRPPKKEPVELEELSTMPNAEVKVFRSGRIIVNKGVDNDSEDEDKLKNLDVIEGPSKIKRRKSDK